jgi:putative SOS response-associated peptidase YedK
MCYRYSLTTLAGIAEFDEQLAEAAAAAGLEWQPRYNVALTSRMPVIKRRQARAGLELMHFGFMLPARSATGRPLLVGNARAETILDQPSFRAAAQHRRCLIPADGFYEWEKQGDARRPHYFTLQDRRPFFFAGIWEPATAAAPAVFCIVTTTPNPLLAAIHDRMPVILGPNSGPAWLGDEPLAPARLAQLCRPLPADKMAAHRVDPRVNNARYEAPDCIVPVG